MNCEKSEKFWKKMSSLNEKFKFQAESDELLYLVDFTWDDEAINETGYEIQIADVSCGRSKLSGQGSFQFSTFNSCVFNSFASFCTSSSGREQQSEISSQDSLLSLRKFFAFSILLSVLPFSIPRCSARYMP